MIHFLRLTSVVSFLLCAAHLMTAQIVIHDPTTGNPTSGYSLPSLCNGGSVEHCFTVSGSGSSYSITNFNVGVGGTIVVSPPNNPSPLCFRYTAPFGFAGNNTLTFTISNNLGQTAQVQITILIVNPNTPIDAGPVQTLCSPVNYTTVTAINPDPLVEGYWTVFTGPGVISGGYDSPHIPGPDVRGGSTVTVSGLQLGVNIFKWTQVYPCAQTFDLVTVYVYNGTPPIADANTCYPSVTDHVTKTVTLCGTNSYTLCGNSPGTAATGTWNIFGGSGTIYNVNNASADVTNLGAGCNSLEWMISNGSCPGGDTKDTLFICVYPTIQEAVTGADVVKCLGASGSIVISGNFPTGANTGEWTFVSGPVTPNIISPNSTSTNLTGLSQPGVYQFKWTITSGPCGSSSDIVSVYIYSQNSPINAGADQDICLPNNSATLEALNPIAPAQGTWTVISGTGSFANNHDPHTTVSGLSVGINTFRWTVNNGSCANNNNYDDVNINVYPASQPTPNAGVDQFLSYSGTPVSTTLNGNSPQAPGTGTWTVTGPSTPVFAPNANTANAGISNLIPGVYTLTWTLNNGDCGGNTSDEMQIYVYDCSSTTTEAGPNQSLCSPNHSVTMAATAAPNPSVGSWSIVQGGGSIASTNSPTTTITNIPIGINIYRWTVSNGACGSYSDEVTVYVYDDGATISNAGANQEFCSGSSPIVVTMNANIPATPATGTWSGPGTISSLNDPSATVSNLPIGHHIFTWTVNNGPCGTAVSQVAVDIFSPNQTLADAGADQQLCVTSNSTVVVGNSLIVPATGTWTVVSGGGTILSPNTQSTEIVNISVGHNVYKWTIYNGPCSVPTVSEDEVVVDVFDTQQPNANAGADQNVCSTAGSITLNGNQVLSPAVGTWTVAPAGPIFNNPNSPNTSVTSLTPGTVYTFTWTIDNGSCGVSFDDVTVNYYSSEQQAANAGSDISICLPTNSAQLNANAVQSPATGTWTLVSGPNTPLFNASANNTTLSGLIAGTYEMKWTVDNGPCATAATSDNIVIQVFSNNQAIANAGPDQELCQPVSFTTLTGNSLIAPATGLWTQISGPSTASINNPNLNQVTVSNLEVGCYVFRWTVNNGSCDNAITYDEVSVCVYSSSQQIANAGADQNICTPLTSTTLEASAIISPAVGTWEVMSGPNTPTFSPNANDPNAVLGNLVVGTYTLRWNVYNGACSNALTSDIVVIKVFDSSADPASAGSLQELCSPNHTVFMSANQAISPAVGTWTIVSGAGSITAVNDPNTSVTNIPVGINCFRWTIDNGGCGTGTTSDEVCVNVYSVNQQVANAGANQDLCSPDDFVIMTANPVTTPAVGQWIQVSGPNTANIVNPNLHNTVIDNLVEGCYVFEWSIDNGVCANALSSDQVEVCIYPGGFPPAFAGNDQELCSPTSVTVMTADAAISPGEGTWTLVSGPNAPVFDINNPTTNVSGLQPGVYVFDWSLNYSSCGAENDEVTIIVYDSTQGEADAGEDQSWCTPVSSTSLNAAPVIQPGYGTWSVVSGDADFIDVHDPATVAYNMSPGTHILVWTVYNGNCLNEELRTDTVVITIHDSAQQPALVGNDISICTPQSSLELTGTVLLTPATGIWTTDGTSTIVSPNASVTTITDLTVGVHEFCWTIDNGECAPPSSSDCLLVYVYDDSQEAADAGEDQELCAFDNTCATLDANAVIAPGVGTWTQIDGLTDAVFTDPHSPNTTVCDLIPGVYVFEWCINNGPCAQPTCDQVTITVYPSNTPPASVGSDIELCTPQINVEMNASVANPPAYGEWTLVSGGGTIDDIDNPQTLIYDLEVGENIFSWCVFSGTCANSGSCDTLSIFVYDFDAPAADAGEDQDICGTNTTITLEAEPASNPGVGTWTAQGNYASAIDDIHNPSTTLSGLGVGEYFFTWTVYNGSCTVTNTSDAVRIRIFDDAQTDADAGADQHICTPQSMVSMSANSATFPATGTWESLPGGSGTIVSTSNAQTQIIGLLPGVSGFVWTINNGSCVPSVTTDTVYVYVYDTGIPPADAGDDQYFCAPLDLSSIEATLNGSEVQGAGSGEWTQVSGPSTATIESADENITQVSDLVVGVYVFKWSVENGPCGVTEDEVSIFINDPNLAPAYAGEDIDYCTPVDSHQFIATPVAYPAQGSWSAFPPVPISPDAHDPNAVASNLGVGYLLFIWTVDNGACGETDDVIQVRIYDENQPSANAGVDIELCYPQTEVNLSSTDIYDPAVGIWDLVSGCGQLTSVNNPNTLVSELCLGTSCFRWTVNNGPCPNGTTMDTVCVRVFDPGVVVTVSEDQSICTPENTVTVSGTEPEDPSTGTWSIVSGGGTILQSNNPTTEITDLPVGINTFRWEFYNGPCDNQLHDDVTINVYDSSHPWADAGADVEMCYPENSTTLTGNTPIVPAIGYWTLVSGAGDIASPNSPQTGISNMEVGQNIFVWTIQNGPCADSVMTDTLIVHVFPENPQVADGGPDREICTPETSVTLEAVAPESPSVGTWEIISLNGEISDIHDPNATVDFLTVGTHTLKWTIDNGPCNDDAESTVTIHVYDQTAQDAEAVEDIELCAPESSTAISANEAISPGIGYWTIITSGSNAQIDDASSASANISGLSIGVTELTWSIDNGPCGISIDTLRITVYDPSSPNASVSEDELICDIPECVELNGSMPSYPAYGWWTQIAGDNTAEIANGSSAVTTACGLALNETAFVWNVYNGSCANSMTTDTVWFYIYDSTVGVANAGEDFSYCDLGLINHELHGSEVTGTIQGLAVGTWTGESGEILYPNSNVTMVNDLPAGVHCFTWTVDNGACGTTSDEVCISVFNQNQISANAGESVEICENEFLSFYLNGNEPLPPAIGYWQVIEGPAVLQGENSYDAYVLSLGAIINELEDVSSTLAWTIDNGECGTTSDTVVYVLKDCETLEIPNAFSPNGDGTNDEFYIPNLEYYPNNRLQVFNRWGVLVYEAAPYKNDWDGRSSRSGSLGENLPIATYYYVLNLGESYGDDQDKVFTGYVFLKR